MKDPIEFRKRFAQWKLGIKPYDAGKIVLYDDGKPDNNDQEEGFSLNLPEITTTTEDQYMKYWKYPKHILDSYRTYGYTNMLDFVNILDKVKYPTQENLKEGIDTLGWKNSISDYYHEAVRNYNKELAKSNFKYIGGTPEESRLNYFKLDKELTDAINRKAKIYGINPQILKYRLAHEGFIDDLINAINYAITNKAEHPGYINSDGGVRYGNDLLRVNKYSGFGNFGLDDVADLLFNNKVKLKDGEVWFDEHDYLNEKGRFVHSVTGNTTLDSIGILAATLKYFRDLVKEDYPKASPKDLDRYALMYYNRGIAGGRSYINNDGTGYDYSKYNFGKSPRIIKPLNKRYN